MIGMSTYPQDLQREKPWLEASWEADREDHPGEGAEIQ